MNIFRVTVAAAISLLTFAIDSEAADPVTDPQIPADVVAMLKEHIGKWRTEGEWTVDGKTLPVAATWECSAAVRGVGNVCTWHHEWADRAHDSALEIMGYDPKLKMLSITRVNDAGVIGTVATPVHGNKMLRTWTSENQGKTSIGKNEIVVKAPGEWVQHMTIERDGKRTTEMKVTHHRVQ